MIEMRGSWRDVTPVGMALARLMQVFLLGVTPHVIALQPVKKTATLAVLGYHPPQVLNTPSVSGPNRAR